jgi:hypothetical protein
MNFRATGKYAVGALALPAFMTLAALPSHAQANSASHVTAEMTKGKLSPAESKPCDTVAIKLKDDVRSNGVVVLKKGTTITGVVRNVKRVDSKGEKAESRGQAQSMLEVEWLAPAVQSRAAQSLSFAIQSVFQQEQNERFGDDFGLASSAAGSSTASLPARTGSGAALLGSAGSAVAAAAVPTSAVSTVSATSSSTSTPGASGRSNVALLSMPSVVALDQQSSAAIESWLGTPSSGQLFRVGHGELISAGGSKQSVDLYSHLSNDTVITSPGKAFEISSGAQMQMLVGVNRR